MALFAVNPVESIVSVVDALLLGGFRTLVRFMNERVVDGPPTLAFLVGLTVLIVGVHLFVRWLANVMQRQLPIVRLTSWRLRSSIALVSLVMTFFLAGICAVGVTHQMTWILSDPEGVWIDSDR